MTTRNLDREAREGIDRVMRACQTKGWATPAPDGQWVIADEHRAEVIDALLTWEREEEKREEVEEGGPDAEVPPPAPGTSTTPLAAEAYHGREPEQQLCFWEDEHEAARWADIARREQRLRMANLVGPGARLGGVPRAQAQTGKEN